jgi:hypothetical protein
MQIAFISNDLRSDADRWSRTFGVGPFFELTHIPVINTRYRGEPTSMDISAAIAYWGDIQLELIQQFDDAPSVYRDGCCNQAMGIHHLGVLVEDYEAAYAQMLGLDATPVTETQIPGAVRATYFEVPEQLPFIEILEVQPEFRAGWNDMKRAAAGWTGDRPYRTNS